GVKFETYASLRIRGAIIDNIRKMDWVPRTLRQKNKQYESVYNKLEDELGREPTEVEMADQLGMTVPEIQELEKKSSVFSLISLDEYLEQNHESSFSGIIDTETDTPEAYIDKQELHGMLTEAIEKLSEKEQKVIILYYFEELTLKEISAIMNVSESRISQIHSKAVGKLHVKLGKFRQILYV
ncbi:MAG: FliA/WhiG family RNA polymerase sigma factor, partial [Defluviitaleaceae bacterium]|nr:FliA/WhiG family RNA polymerase sigma factor [Defluviitaleaceae bacterium]